MPCPKELAAATGITPYPHTKTPNINTTHNQAKPLGRHHLPVHWQRPTAASRQPSKRTGWSAHVSSSVRHTLPTCQSRRASVLLDHEDHGLDGGDQLQPLGRPAGRAAAAGAVATADGRLEGHHAAPTGPLPRATKRAQRGADAWGAHSINPCVPPSTERVMPVAWEALAGVGSSRSRIVNVLYRFCPAAMYL